ncbi:glycoside hydrolase [Marasmius fiardii PR-910]|nr:glycoside hydrolase [Marasmius fiardii PR-910]
MISSSGTRATFINSVKSFMTEYKVDGIDIDFEYPSAIERDAPPTDTPNLTAFFEELRSAIPSAVVSIATPAGYWFLKGFEIDKIAEHVDYLNMMSYDYHGQWDTNVTDQAPVTNPHTSIKDMEDSTLLYLRAGIDLSKMTGGGFPGDCTLTPGYLTQFEINGLLNKGITPTRDEESQTYWFNDQGSLITFDQDETWNIKTDFAANRCFRGTFIW